MKKSAILLPVLAVFAYFTLTSSQTGSPGNYSGIHGAGYTGCGSSNVCHGNRNADVSLYFTLTDSAGNAMLQYKPGRRHIIKMLAINLSADNLTKFGFQFSIVSGVTSGYAQAGSYYRPTLPAGTQLDTTVNPYLFQQITNLNPSSGTGTYGTFYTTQVTWTAPAAGTGQISIFGVACLVNNNALADTLADKWNNTVYRIDEEGSTGVAALAKTDGIYAAPVPVGNQLRLHTVQPLNGYYSVHVYAISGANVGNLYLAGSDMNSSIVDATSWAPGIYTVVIEGEGARKVLSVVKQ